MSEHSPLPLNDPNLPHTRGFRSFDRDYAFHFDSRPLAGFAVTKQAAFDLLIPPK
jgi:hypothetical protein